MLCSGVFTMVKCKFPSVSKVDHGGHDISPELAPAIGSGVIFNVSTWISVRYPIKIFLFLHLTEAHQSTVYGWSIPVDTPTRVGNRRVVIPNYASNSSIRIQLFSCCCVDDESVFHYLVFVASVVGQSNNLCGELNRSDPPGTRMFATTLRDQYIAYAHFHYTHFKNIKIMYS